MKAFLQRRFRKYVSKLTDPDLPLRIGRQEIKAPLSHPLRNIMPLYPDYNHNLGRLLAYLEEKQPAVNLIDIGANIGDTVAFVRNYTDCPILCVEGSSRYFKKLQKNLELYRDVEAAFAIVTDKKDRGSLVIHGNNTNTGTPTTGSGSAPALTLEEILWNHPAFQKPAVIKTDTDGFDTLILRGSEALLREQHPVLFFEYDPHFIRLSGDDPAGFLEFLLAAGYRYFIFYTNLGDLLLGMDAGENKDLLCQLTDYFSGRNILNFADVAAYPAHMEAEYLHALKKERAHFAEARHFSSCAQKGRL